MLPHTRLQRVCQADPPSSTQSVAAASLYLASKLEEEIRMCRELLSVFYRLERRAQGLSLDPLDIYSQVCCLVFGKGHDSC